MNDVIFLTGIAGVGKTTLADRAAQHVDFVYLSAGSLIADALASHGRQIPRDVLRNGPVIDNQALLLEGFRRATELVDKPIVLDGHVMVRSDHDLVVLPETLFDQLGCQHFIAVTHNPEQIAANRRSDVSRSRQPLTPEQLGRDQAAMLVRVNELGRRRQCRVSEISLVDFDSAVCEFKRVVAARHGPASH